MTNLKEPVEESVHDEVARLTREIEELSKEQVSLVNLVGKLRDSEDPANGVFHHQEIFEAQQNKLRLEVEIQMRQAKINRLRLGEELHSRLQ